MIAAHLLICIYITDIVLNHRRKNIKAWSLPIFSVANLTILGSEMSGIPGKERISNKRYCIVELIYTWLQKHWIQGLNNPKWQDNKWAEVISGTLDICGQYSGWKESQWAEFCVDGVSGGNVLGGQDPNGQYSAQTESIWAIQYSGLTVS